MKYWCGCETYLENGVVKFKKKSNGQPNCENGGASHYAWIAIQHQGE